MADHLHITGQTVLITGAAGSIGSALCQRLLAYRPAELRLLNLTEHGLVTLMDTLTPQADGTVLTPILGSVTDAALLARWMPGVETVIHTAAYKHVPVCEQHPCVAVLNNIGGTLAVCQAAQAAGVARCLLISSDKAVEPASVMGATKAVGERVMHGSGPGFLVVRFGNVLDSVGSVLPRWRAQLAAGQAITVTDPDCTRYFMTVDEACTLILATLALAVAQGTYLFDMGEPQRLQDLAERVLAEAPGPGYIVYTGLRPGEKLTEQLTTGTRTPTGHPQVWQGDNLPALKEDHPRLHQLMQAAQTHDAEATWTHLWTLARAEEWRLGLPGPSCSDELTFVAWKWHGPDPERAFPSQAVNVLYAMLARHYHAPFRLVCLTDDPKGIRSDVHTLDLPRTKADTLRAPQYSTSTAKLFPSCYRRLWLFSEEAIQLGPRLCCIDLDVVILGDITALLRRHAAVEFVGWADAKFGWSKIAGGLWLHTPGTRQDVWDDFDVVTSPALAKAAGHKGSDQAWLSYKLHPPAACLTQADGVFKLNWLKKAGTHPPPGVKMVFTVGTQPPWHDATIRAHRWILQHWREGE